jgi:ParB family chromosome partitioning protein
MPKEINRSFMAFDDIAVVPDFNGRKSFTRIPELARSLDQNGLAVPLLVREGGPSKTDGTRKVILVSGERRQRAISLLRDPAFVLVDDDGKPLARKTTRKSWDQVEVKFTKADAKRLAILNYIENKDREDLEPLEEAEQIARVMRENNLTQAEFCQQTGSNKAHVSLRLALLKKTAPEVREALEAKTLSATQVREVVALPQEQQKAVLAEVKDRQRTGKQVSVQDVKLIADKEKAKLGLKQTKDRKVAKDGTEYDKDKVSKAREVYEGKSLDLRPKTAIIEQLGGLMQRLERANISDQTKAATKVQISTIEWLLGLRENL